MLWKGGVYDEEEGWSDKWEIWARDEFVLDPTRVTLAVGGTGWDGVGPIRGHLYVMRVQGSVLGRIQTELFASPSMVAWSPDSSGPGTSTKPPQSPAISPMSRSRGC